MLPAPGSVTDLDAHDVTVCDTCYAKGSAGSQTMCPYKKCQCKGGRALGSEKTRRRTTEACWARVHDAYGMLEATRYNHVHIDSVNHNQRQYIMQRLNQMAMHGTPRRACPGSPFLEQKLQQQVHNHGHAAHAPGRFTWLEEMQEGGSDTTGMSIHRDVAMWLLGGSARPPAGRGRAVARRSTVESSSWYPEAPITPPITHTEVSDRHMPVKMCRDTAGAAGVPRAVCAPAQNQQEPAAEARGRR